MIPLVFDDAFKALTDNPPFPWQRRIYDAFVRGEIPAACVVPTGLGKTSVIAVWLIALANGAPVPRRLIYVVNRRTVVDQTTDEVEKIRRRLDVAGLDEPLRRFSGQLAGDASPLAVSTLRGQFADNREWSSDPSRPAVVCGTVDMIGSRLLFSGYGIGRSRRPLHAGFLGQHSLLIHDEAHLEPAFQQLLERVEQEQHGRDFRPMRVMALTATPRGNAKPHGIDDTDRANPEAQKRLDAPKNLILHAMPDDKPADPVVRLVQAKATEANRAVLVFLRTVDDVMKVRDQLKKRPVQILTGTMRGLERNRLSNPRDPNGCPIFARFLPKPKADAPDDEQWKVTPRNGETVFLICTSAGEVGVNLSADDLVCDLTTFDSMAQRFGRVNRFGQRSDTTIDVVHPTAFDAKNPYDVPRSLTLALLQRLGGSASPTALSELSVNEREGAFAPPPDILPTPASLFDAWALTTIRERMPGRPFVEPYLHGKAEWEPPETQFAWRREIDELTLAKIGYEPSADELAEWLDDYALANHELLREPTHRALKQIELLAKSHRDSRAWLVNADGEVVVTTLEQLANKDRKEQIENVTVILPPSVGGLNEQGMLDGKAEPRDGLDVADALGDRMRVWEPSDALGDGPEGMILTHRFHFDTGDDDAPSRVWSWYEKPKRRDAAVSKYANEAITWEHHTRDVVARLEAILRGLDLDDALKQALVVAATWHDSGKRRELWQRSIGNPNPSDFRAKSAKGWRSRVTTRYRHEFGSLLDVEKDAAFQALAPDLRELALHLIAAHHGRARPHFAAEEAFDPSAAHTASEAIAVATPTRFARLQRRYGRWGLAYLESLLRAADHSASASPSEIAK